VRIRATEGLLYIESNRSYMAPVCAGSWITVRHNRRVTDIARTDGSSKHACNSVVSLSENMDFCSHLHIIFVPFNASSNMHFHTHCTLFHAPGIQITPEFPVLVPRYGTSVLRITMFLFGYEQPTQNDLRFITACNQITPHPSSLSC